MRILSEYIMACEMPKSFRLGTILIVLSYLGFTTCLPHRGHGDHHSRARCDGNQLRLKSDEQCYNRGSQGPCGPNMLIREDPRERGQGRCTCISAVNCKYWPHAQHAEHEGCYPLYERGPCREDEWFVPMFYRKHPLSELRGRGRNKDGIFQGKCVLRECPPYQESYQWFSAAGECYQVGTQGYCRNPAARMYFTKDFAIPQCSDTPIVAPDCRPSGGAPGPSSGPSYGPPAPPPSTGPGYTPSVAPPSINPSYGSSVPEIIPPAQNPQYGVIQQVPITQIGLPDYSGTSPGANYGSPSIAPGYNSDQPEGQAPNFDVRSSDIPLVNLNAFPIPIQQPSVSTNLNDQGAISVTPVSVPVLEPVPSEGYSSAATESGQPIKPTKGIANAGALSCKNGGVSKQGVGCLTPSDFK